MTTELHLRPLWQAIGWIMLGAVIGFSLASNPPDAIFFPHADKLKHLLSYAVLMAWFGQIYTHTSTQRYWLMGLTLMGVTLEFLQGWGGVRFFDTADMLANALGALLGYWLTRGPLAGTLSRIGDQLKTRKAQ